METEKQTPCVLQVKRSRNWWATKVKPNTVHRRKKSRAPSRWLMVTPRIQHGVSQKEGPYRKLETRQTQPIETLKGLRRLNCNKIINVCHLFNVVNRWLKVGMLSVYKHLRLAVNMEAGAGLHTVILTGFNLRQELKRELKSKYNEVLSSRNPFTLDAARKKVSRESRRVWPRPPQFLQGNGLVKRNLKVWWVCTQFRGVFICWLLNSRQHWNFRFSCLLICSPSLSLVDSGQPCSYQGWPLKLHSSKAQRIWLRS